MSISYVRTGMPFAMHCLVNSALPANKSMAPMTPTSGCSAMNSRASWQGAGALGPHERRRGMRGRRSKMRALAREALSTGRGGSGGGPEGAMSIQAFTPPLREGDDPVRRDQVPVDLLPLRSHLERDAHLLAPPHQLRPRWRSRLRVGQSRARKLHPGRIEPVNERGLQGNMRAGGRRRTASEPRNRSFSPPAPRRHTHAPTEAHMREGRGPRTRAHFLLPPRPPRLL